MYIYTCCIYFFSKYIYKVFEVFACILLVFSCEADFVTKCKLIKERLDSRESEVLGKWFTEEAMRKAGTWSSTTIRQMVAYCRKFPEALVRQGILYKS